MNFVNFFEIIFEQNLSQQANEELCQHKEQQLHEKHQLQADLLKLSEVYSGLEVKYDDMIKLLQCELALIKADYDVVKNEVS